MKNAKHKTRNEKPKAGRTAPLSSGRGVGGEVKNDRLISFIVFAFAFLLYANTLNHGYVLDDDVVYLKNKDVQAGTSGIKSILNHSFIYGFTGHNDQSYRPVVLIIYAIEKEFFGNNPQAGHFINVLLFALACVLLFHLVKRLFKALPFGEGWGGVAVVLLFAAHPIHTEAVANIKGRDDILNFIFFVLSLTYILRHIDEGRKKYFLFSVIFFFLALLCKEMAVTFLAVIPLTIFFFRELSLKKIGAGMLSFTGAFILYMLIRGSVLDTVTFEEKMKVMNNSLAAATNEADRIATAILILGKYIQLLLFPHPLSWDYSFNQIPIVSFSDIKVIGTLCVFTTLGIYAALGVINKTKPTLIPWAGIRSHFSNFTSQTFAYCILFFFITMSVVSNVFIMIGSTLGERFLFVPSMAFCIAIPFALNRFGKNILLAGVGIIVALFSFKTFDRNKDWKDNLSLFEAGSEATPNSSRAQGALGSAYRELAESNPAREKLIGVKQKERDKNLTPAERTELFKKAIIYYKKAIEILPENTEALYNAGVCYYRMGDKENALKIYEQALKVSPEYTNAANNTGVIYFERKDYENAKKYFLQAIKYDPNNSDALGNLGAINHNQGNMQEAIEFYKRALAVNPGNQNVRNNLAKAEQALNGKK